MNVGDGMVSVMEEGGTVVVHDPRDLIWVQDYRAATSRPQGEATPPSASEPQGEATTEFQVGDIVFDYNDGEARLGTVLSPDPIHPNAHPHMVRVRREAGEYGETDIWVYSPNMLHFLRHAFRSGDRIVDRQGLPGTVSYISSDPENPEVVARMDDSRMETYAPHELRGEAESPAQVPRFQIGTAVEDVRGRFQGVVSAIMADGAVHVRIGDGRVLSFRPEGLRIRGSTGFHAGDAVIDNQGRRGTITFLDPGNNHASVRPDGETGDASYAYNITNLRHAPAMEPVEPPRRNDRPFSVGDVVTDNLYHRQGTVVSVFGDLVRVRRRDGQVYAVNSGILKLQGRVEDFNPGDEVWFISANRTRYPVTVVERVEDDGEWKVRIRYADGAVGLVWPNELTVRQDEGAAPARSAELIRSPKKVNLIPKSHMPKRPMQVKDFGIGDGVVYVPAGHPDDQEEGIVTGFSPDGEMVFVEFENQEGTKVRKGCYARDLVHADFGKRFLADADEQTLRELGEI